MDGPTPPTKSALEETRPDPPTSQAAQQRASASSSEEVAPSPAVATEPKAGAGSLPHQPPSPSAVAVVLGDLTRAHEKIIVQQCNCTSKYPKGLSAVLFKAFPHADVYSRRKREKLPPSQPGTISLHGPPGRRVCNLFGQYGPGKPASSGRDSAAQRIRYFRRGLASLASLGLELESVAFPYKIGCGLGGGHWPDYLSAITEFANRVAPSRVVLYRLPPDGSRPGRGRTGGRGGLKRKSAGKNPGRGKSSRGAPK